MKVIESMEFDAYWKGCVQGKDDAAAAVKEIIAAVRSEGDTAVRRFASRFDKCSPTQLEVPLSIAKQAAADLRSSEPELTAALELAAEHIKRFALKQKEQFFDFEYEMEPGLVTGQRVIPVERAAVYVPGGRFPLFSSVLMCMIPAFCAGVEEVILSSPPTQDGLPDKKILAAAAIVSEIGTDADFGHGSFCIAKTPAKTLGTAAPMPQHNNNVRIFAIGGAQAIAALAIGTESVPRVDVIAGPGNKYVAAAKRQLFGEVGIDFIAGPTDVLVIADGQTADIAKAADLVAADMVSQAEHDPDARARALVPNKEFAEKILAAIERRIKKLPMEETARASLDSGGLIVIYRTQEEAVRIANIIAPEHLELQTADADTWIPRLKNYGSLFIGSLCAEVLGDYSAGINHTLPTSTSARFSGGLSVRHFLKTVTTLRCAPSEDYQKARNAAETLARAEGLEGHAQSAAARG